MNSRPSGWNAQGWRSTSWKRRPASALSRFHSSSGSHASAPSATASHTRMSRSARRPSGNISIATKPTPITADEAVMREPADDRVPPRADAVAVQVAIEVVLRISRLPASRHSTVASAKRHIRQRQHAERAEQRQQHRQHAGMPGVREVRPRAARSSATHHGSSAAIRQERPPQTRADWGRRASTPNPRQPRGEPGQIRIRPGQMTDLPANRTLRPRTAASRAASTHLNSVAAAQSAMNFRFAESVCCFNA